MRYARNVARASLESAPMRLAELAALMQRTEGAEINASYALQWAIVDRLRREGRCRWYDLGGDGNSPGLVQFKTGFVGSTGKVATIPAWRDYSESTLSTIAAKAAQLLKGR